jgi:hypothetical protein
VTLICYAFMSWATWFVGRKHYPVPYPLARMGLYVLAALGLFAAGEALEPHLPAAAMWGVRVVFFAAYVGLIYFLENTTSRHGKQTEKPLS